MPRPQRDRVGRAIRLALAVVCGLVLAAVLCTRQLRAAQTGRGAAAIQASTGVHRITCADGENPLAASLYAAEDGVRVYCPVGEMPGLPGIVTPIKVLDGMRLPAEKLPARTLRVGRDGVATDATPTLPAHVGHAGWDCSGLSVLQYGAEQVVFSQVWTHNLDYVGLAYANAEGAVELRSLAVPGYASPGSPFEWPRDSCALMSGSPSAALVGSDVWLVSGRGGNDIVLSHCPWGKWGVHDWAIAQSLGAGIVPDLAFAEGYGFFVVFMKMPSPGGTYSEGGCRAPLLLTRSSDGANWTEPEEILDGVVVHQATVTADRDLGLVVLYVADEENGLPLYAARSADMGRTWGEPVLLSERGIRCLDPDALLYGGRLYGSYRMASMDAFGWGSCSIPTPEAVYTLALDPNDLPVE